MAYRVRHTSLSADYLWALNAFAAISPPFVMGGWFRCHDASAGTNAAPFLGLNRGNTNNQQWAFGFVPSPTAGSRVLTFDCQESVTSDSTTDAVVYVENEWWFAAIHVPSATSRTFYYQRPGDATLQSFTGSADSISPSDIDTLDIGAARGADTWHETPMDCFQIGLAIGSSNVTACLADMQAWADGQKVETIDGLDHAWPLVGTGGDYDDYIGTAHLTADTTNGWPTGQTDPFTPTDPSGVTSSGTPAAQDATTAGTAERVLTGSGTPAAQAVSLAGTAERVLTCSGTLLSAASSTTGTATLQLKLLLTASQGRELRDEEGAVVASLANIAFEWYDKDTDTEGNPAVSGTLSTNANGEATVQLTGSTLTAGQFGLLVLEHPSDNTIRGIYRIPVS